MWSGGRDCVVGGGSSAGRVHRWCRQCVVTKSSSRDVPPLVAAMPAIAHLVPFGALLLRRATACDRVLPSERKLFVCSIIIEACVVVGGRWVPADGSNLREASPLFEMAWPRSGNIIRLGATPRLQLIYP